MDSVLLMSPPANGSSDSTSRLPAGTSKVPNPSTVSFGMGTILLRATGEAGSQHQQAIDGLRVVPDSGGRFVLLPVDRRATADDVQRPLALSGKRGADRGSRGWNEPKIGAVRREHLDPWIRRHVD